MTTKAEYIAQARAANPKPQYATVNGEQIELTDDEYETSLEAWAEMKVQQEAVQTAKETALAAKTSARNKLAALGLTDAEVNALLGNTAEELSPDGGGE